MADKKDGKSTLGSAIVAVILLFVFIAWISDNADTTDHGQNRAVSTWWYGLSPREQDAACLVWYQQDSPNYELLCD